jgi:hypothetical protein
MATEKEIMALNKLWSTALGEALAPLISEDDKQGLQVLRVFYAFKAKDGQFAAGQLGVTPEDRQEDGVKLIASILTILSDADKNWSLQKIEVTKKS